MPAKAKKPDSRLASYNWPEIRREYVEGIAQEDTLHFPTLAQLAKRWKLSEAALESRSSSEGWQSARDQLQLIRDESLRRDRAMEFARKAAAFDDKAFTVADALLTFAQNRLATHVKQQTTPTTKELRELAEVTLKAHYVGREARGKDVENLQRLDRLPAFTFVITGGKGRTLEGESKPTKD
jgi:hypothetical protein